MTDQPRWPRGTPIEPDGHGPGGGRFMPIGAPGASRFLPEEGMAVGRLADALAQGRRFQVRGPYGDWEDVQRVDMNRGTGVLVHEHGEMTRSTYLAREIVRDEEPPADWARRVSSRLSGQHPLTAGMMSHEQVASYLGRTDYEVVGDAGGSFGEVEFRRYSDGTMLAYKKINAGEDAEGEISAETQASVVARALGAPAPAVVRDPHDRRGMLMEYIPNDGADSWPAVPLYETQSGRMIGLLDTLITNTDRHGGNVREPRAGRVVGIDHGRAFRAVWHRGQPDVIAPVGLVAGSEYGRRLFRSMGHGQYQQWYYSREAIDEARRRLETIKDEIDPKRWAGIDRALTMLHDMSGAGTWLDS